MHGFLSALVIDFLVPFNWDWSQCFAVSGLIEGFLRACLGKVQSMNCELQKATEEISIKVNWEEPTSIEKDQPQLERINLN